MFLDDFHTIVAHLPYVIVSGLPITGVFFSVKTKQAFAIVDPDLTETLSDTNIFYLPAIFPRLMIS
jgi:hypothetical protein